VSVVPCTTVKPSFTQDPEPRAVSPEEELDLDVEDEDVSGYHSEREESKPDVFSEVANASGGGRGYVPGETPDDPTKRHKCDVCGRGFARAFNLKVSNRPLLPIHQR
jgi:hypothetical protein